MSIIFRKSDAPGFVVPLQMECFQFKSNILVTNFLSALALMNHSLVLTTLLFGQFDLKK